MKLIIDVKDNKADFVMELLKNFSFIKAQPISPSKATFLQELKGAVNEVALAKKGKLKLQSAKEFLNEL